RIETQPILVTQFFGNQAKRLFQVSQFALIEPTRRQLRKFAKKILAIKPIATLRSLRHSVVEYSTSTSSKNSSASSWKSIRKPPGERSLVAKSLTLRCVIDRVDHGVRL